METTTAVTGAICPQCSRTRDIPFYMSVAQMVCPFDNVGMRPVREIVRVVTRGENR